MADISLVDALLGGFGLTHLHNMNPHPEHIRNLLRIEGRRSVTIEDVRTDWLRIPLSQPIADSTHVLRFIDLILVEIRAGDHVGTSYMLSFDYAPALLRGIVDQELKRHVLGQPADAIRGVYERNLAATEYIGQDGVAMWGIAAVDVALWDLLARRLGVPAAILFGRNAKAVPVYGSGGWLS